MVVQKRNGESVLDVVIWCVPLEGDCFWGVVRGLTRVCSPRNGLCRAHSDFQC
jgi:hypothetical protein